MVAFKNIFFFLLLLPGFQLLAQVKVEKEYRVRTGKVPRLARQWLTEAFGPVKKLRWYFEDTSGKQSFEAKFRERNQFYSVEFSKTGIIEDVEIERNWLELPAATRAALESSFSALPDFRILRIQEQWTGSPEGLASSVQAGSAPATIRYEIEFIATLEGESAMWEGTFSPSGKLLSYRKILIRPANNLNF